MDYRGGGGDQSGGLERGGNQSGGFRERERSTL